MNGHWAVPVLASILILGGFGFSQSAYAISISPTTSASTLAANIAGSGITIVGGSEVFTGLSGQAGEFTLGSPEIGIASGIVLHTGDVAQIPGPNVFVVPVPGGETMAAQASGDELDEDINLDLASGGYALLDILAGAPTEDAAVLEFDFTFDGGGGGDVFMNFVFASEEYIDWEDSTFNDAFAFYVDGINIALVPNTILPVNINNVNSGTNSESYINNVVNTNGLDVAGVDISFDGFTTVLTAESLSLGSGTHTMIFAVADAGDGFLDAAVFLQAGSFSNTEMVVEPPGGPTVGGTSIPIDTTALLVTGAQTTTPWMILGGLAAVGIVIGVFVIKRRQ